MLAHLEDVDRAAFRLAHGGRLLPRVTVTKLGAFDPSGAPAQRPSCGARRCLPLATSPPAGRVTAAGIPPPVGSPPPAHRRDGPGDAEGRGASVPHMDNAISTAQPAPRPGARRPKTALTALNELPPTEHGACFGG